MSWSPASNSEGGEGFVVREVQGGEGLSPGGVNGDMRFSLRYVMLHARRTNSSSVLDSISLTSGDSTSSGDDSNLVHYCAEFVTLGLHVLSVGGGLPGCIPVVRRKGV